MKHHLKVINALMILASLSLVSCFQKEEPNAECDILEAILHVEKNEILDVLYHPSDSLVRVDYSTNEINFTVKQGVDLSRMAPRFVLTEGATISPESGSIQDFSKGKVKYTVTSESKEWQREYYVGFSSSSLIPIFDYEEFELEPIDKKFYIWFSKLNDGSLISNWASGNAGYTMGAPKGTTPEDYPTAPERDGVNGYALKMTTLSTGPLGKFAKKPIAGGSLWLGKFDMSSALTDPMKSIIYGIPFDRKPVRLTGYYKFTPGPVVTDRDMNEVKGAVDRPDIFAVLFRNHDQQGKPINLYADDVKNSPQIAGFAQVKDLRQTDKWLQFEAEFKYFEELDPELLRAQGYSLSIMFNSSEQGSVFIGAVGSELYIDSVELVCSE